MNIDLLFLGFIPFNSKACRVVFEKRADEHPNCQPYVLSGCFIKLSYVISNRSIFHVISRFLPPIRLGYRYENHPAYR